MTAERFSTSALRAVPTLWSTVAFNLFVLLVAVIAVELSDDLAWCVWLPVASLALSGAVGFAHLLSARTRPFGVGCLGGTAVSALVFLVLAATFFVAYFVVPGGHELS